tara:strand:+ start:50 stop:439 length:390 start_codon:yes stop_codon:yes gene_type:complete
MDDLLELLEKNKSKTRKGFLKTPNFDNNVMTPKGFLKSPKLTDEQKEMLEIQKKLRKKRSLERDPSGMTSLLNQGGLSEKQSKEIDVAEPYGKITGEDFKKLREASEGKFMTSRGGRAAIRGIKFTGVK